MKARILVVDDDAAHRQMLQAVLEKEGYAVELAESGEKAVDAVKARFFDLILMDIRMKNMGGLEAQQKTTEISPQIPVIMMTAYASVKTAIEAMKTGAYDYLTKPLDIDELNILVRRALYHYRLEQDKRNLQQQVSERFSFKNFIGDSNPMKRVFEKIAVVAATEATVLITGESGTGKELVANAIHLNSDRKERPMIMINCAALPESLLESELFGHEQGAFTGAMKQHKGRFQQAHRSSIFLDEIVEMSPSTQAKVLRVIQGREVEPLGGTGTVKVDVRVIAATNKDLPQEVQEGRFREDLYYRLNVFEIEMPPLRKRREDIPQLAAFFLKRYAQKNRKSIKAFTAKAMDALMRHSWSGNVRELENTVERAVIMCRGETIKSMDLPKYVMTDQESGEGAGIRLTTGRSLKEVEKEMILRTLREVGGNRTHAAKILGISRRTLQLKIKGYSANDL